MLGEGFTIAATPFITDAFCKCGNTLKQVSNGLFGSAMFCTKCEKVYTLKLVQAPTKDVGSEFLGQCRKETKDE